MLLPKFKEVAEKYRKDDGYYIAISMAHTHVEKLVFPVLRITENVFDITGIDKLVNIKNLNYQIECFIM